jgi:cell division protease FtsH
VATDRFKRRHAVGAVLLVAVAVALVVVHQQGSSAKPTVVPASSRLAESQLTRGAITLLVQRPVEQSVLLLARDGVRYKVGLPQNDGLKPLLATARAHGVPIEVDTSGFGGGGGLGLGSVVGLLFPLTAMLAMVALVVLLAVQMRGGGGLKIQPARSRVSFSDIAGCGEVIEEVSDIRDFLADPERFRGLGARIPKGVLLYGPPGTGKTLVAKAIASEAGVPFYAVAGSDFAEKFVGVGSARIKRLFNEAKKHAPAIIFIDEIDAVGRARGGGGDGGAREGDNTLNQLLRQMDGFEVSEHPVVVVAASNRLEMLDAALTRAGRFDRHVAVDPPDRAGRLDVLRIHSRGKALAPGIDLEALAAKTGGMSGAELENVLNEAAIQAGRRRSGRIDVEDVEEGFVRVVAGARKQNRTLSERARRAVAYHEGGHALAAELLDSAEKVQSISIQPRGGAAGFMIKSDDEDAVLQTRTELEASLVTMLAGRAAEDVVFSEITTGAANDLERASAIVHAMITKLGMGETLGLYVIPAGVELPAEARDEVKATLNGLYERAKTLLAEHRDLLDTVAEELLAAEKITRERFLELVGPAVTAERAA